MRALAITLLAALAPVAAHAAPEVVTAYLRGPTERYDHAVLGDALEYEELRILWRDCGHCQMEVSVITLPPDRVFEDVTARVVDADGDGQREVMVVETDMARGATLAIYGITGKIAATPPIGETRRWLAPVGVGDFDGDGRPEIAYVDRPHLAKELVFLRLEGGRLTELSRMTGLTNHRIGHSVITGGVRRCAGQPDAAVVLDAGWREMVAVHLDGVTPVAQALGPFTKGGMRSALACSK